MQKRNLAAAFLLHLVTFGIYTIVWYVKTKGELVQRGGQVPSAWLLLLAFVPLVNLYIFYWLYKYYKAANQVTSGRVSMLLFWLPMIFGFILGIVSATVFTPSASEIDSQSVEVSSILLPQAIGLLLGLAQTSIFVYIQKQYNETA